MRRELLLSVALVVMALFGARAFSQEGGGEKVLAPEPDVKALVDRLGSGDFGVRQDAEKRLLAMGKDALPALTEAMKGHPDAHVRFEAERILHRISEGAVERPLAEEPRTARPNRVNELLRRLQESGMLAPEELDRWMKMLEEDVAGGGAFSGGGSVSITQSDGERNVELTRGADGSLRVTITREGKSETYEAAGDEEFKAKHPEVWAEIEPLLRGIRFEVGTRDLPPLRPPFGLDEWPWGRRPWRLSPLFPREPVPPPAPGAEAPGGFRLGVWLGEMTEALRHHLRLAEGQGVIVEDVVPGSLASRMGIERFDVIVKVAGRPVTGAEDIRTALADVKEGTTVEVEVIRRGAPLKLLSTR